MAHSYGYIKDKADIRDFAYRVIIEEAALPTSIDLRNLSSPVRDQGDLGSCTGFAIAVGMREFLENSTKSKFVPMSPLFLYYEERALEGSIGEDSGAEPRDGMKVLTKYGCATEKDWPYYIIRLTRPPSTKALTTAKKYTVVSYHRINSLIEAKSCLASGSGFVAGFLVYESFESDRVATTGKMPMPKPYEEILGGHAVFVVGYRTDKTWPGGGYFIVKNSWGTLWGDKGYFYMPFAYFTKANVPDAWVAVATKAVEPLGVWDQMKQAWINFWGFYD